MADPERRCIVTGESGDTFGLIRFVRDPDGVAVPDLDEKLPGRGAWITAARPVLDKAVRRNPFPRAFRTETRIQPDLVDLLERLLRKKCLELIGLAKGAGQLVSGYDKVEEWARAGRIAVMLLASDAGPSGDEKGRRLGRGLPLVDRFDRHELGLALGGENVVHAAVAPGRLAERLAREAGRLGGVAESPRTQLTETDDR